MSFLYPRTIAVTRPKGPAGVGYVGYSSPLQANEDPVVSGIPANIQLKSTPSRTTADGLPSAPPGPPVWRVYIPRSAVAKDVIRDRDIITDDLNVRYQISGAYWNSMGWNIACVRLEAH